MPTRRRLGLALALALVAPFAARAQSAPTAESTDEIVEFERLRAEAAALVAEFLAPVEGGGAGRVELANDLFDRLAPTARDLAPFLVEELDRDLRSTFEFAAVALGRSSAPEAAPALRAAIARADEETGDFPRLRKALAAWALGIHGRVEAIELLEQGRHLVALTPVHEQCSVLEAIAFHTAPDSIAPLVGLVERYASDDERRSWVVPAIGALRRIADPVALPAIVEWLAHDDDVVRREAARALGAFPLPSAVDALVRVLGQPELPLRRAAAKSLEMLADPRATDAIVKQLATEEDLLVRTALYRALVRTLGAKAREALDAHWLPADHRERREFVEAFGAIPSPKIVPRLAQALSDPDVAVGVHAAEALGRLGTASALDPLVAAVGTAEPLLVVVLGRQLGEHHERRAGAALAERLFAILPAEVVDSDTRYRAGKLVEALVDVRHVASAPRLATTASKLRDRPLAERLQSAARRLDLVAQHGDDVQSWASLARDADRDVRRLAYSRLGEIGSGPAVDALVAAFEPADRDDRIEVLRTLADVGSTRATSLVERVLLAPEFDGAAGRQVREMAAWAARSIGGKRMVELLASAVARRNGRDPSITAYAALAGGSDALGLLAAYRRPQLTYLGWHRARAQERLDRLAREIAAGIPPGAIDAPPERQSLLP